MEKRFQEEYQRCFQSRRKKRYHFLTALVAVMVFVFVALQRNENIPEIPLLFVFRGTYFSTSDFFVIVAAGICGYAPGILGFIVLFFSEVFLHSGSSGGNTDFALFIYLTLVILSGYFARKNWYQGIKKPLLAGTIFTAVLGGFLHFVMSVLIKKENIYGNMSFGAVLIHVLPEIVLAVPVLCMYYRFVPDCFKMRLGEGFRYTKVYKEWIKDPSNKMDSVLGKKLARFSVGQVLMLSLFSVLIFNIQYQGMNPDTLPGGRELFIMDAQLILLVSCIAIPFSTFINGIYFRVVVHPLNQMTSVMKQYFSTSEKNRQHCASVLEQLDIATNDEIEELYHALCLMVSDMSGYIEAIQREMELKENLKAAEAESKAKSTFLSNMSHEIRTPINAVLGMDEMILRESGEEQVLEYAENIRTAGNSLLGLINDILDFSKIEAGKMDIVPVEYSFASVLNDLVNMIKQRADDKGLSLIVEADEEIPSILFGDEVRIKQVATNILTNAVKYTEKGSVTIRIKSKKIDDSSIDLFMSIEDTGIGIKQEDIDKLYTAFERIEEERNRNIEGTGLGMNITKQLLHLMGSRLEVESVYGEGSVFSFHLKQNVVEWKPIGDFKEALKRSYTKRETYQESFVAPDAKVLVVDDMPMNLTVFKGLLKKTRVEIITADSGFRCLELVKKMKFDMIFLDYRMPKMDGIETKEKMDALEGNLNQNTPVIALTANAISGAREEYLSHGFHDYLSKPIDAGALEQMVLQHLPAEKVLQGENMKRETDLGDSGENSQNGQPETLETDYNAMEEQLPRIEGLDWNYAKIHLPDLELLKAAIHDFYDVIELHAERLDGMFQEIPAESAWEDYQILVHGMKSSAATIGIIPLSGMAKILEYAARDKDWKRVSSVHPVFLEEWCSYREKLAGLFGSSEADKKVLGNYDQDIIKGLLETIISSMEEFDVDTADQAIGQMILFSYPDALQEKVKELQAAAADVDSDAVSRIAAEFIKML